jgi:putative methionine-R-sulfoxide reductase with GAF domain
MGNIQLFDPSAAALRIEVHHGCSKSFLAFFDCVHVGEAACGAAFQTGSQVTVEDVADSPVFAGRTLELMLDSGVRAVQSIPLVGPSGCIVGILSTHWPRPWRLSNRDFLVLNMLACRTAGWVEERIYCCPHPV